MNLNKTSAADRRYIIMFISLLWMLPMACKNKKIPILPAVFIQNITDITAGSAKIITQVTDEGGGTVTGTGICLSTSANPDLTQQVLNVGAGLGTYTCIPTKLNSNTTYHIRAFATNEAGTAYSADASFKTLP